MLIKMYIQLLSLLLFLGKSVIAQSIYDPDSTNTTTTSISEGSTLGTFVYNVAGSSSLTFSKVFQNPASPSFGFDSNTGELTAPSGLDAESVTSFVFLFSGTDGTVTVTSGTLTVQINNVNDNPPVFSVSNHTVYIVKTVPNGYTVYTASATDLDISFINAFSITAGNTGSTFDIDQFTGVITVQTASNLDPSVTPLYTLTIQVTDGTFTDDMTLNIYVEDDHCVPDPCFNSATCMNSNGTFLCTCAEGYLGVTCSDDDHCFADPCFNSATCENSNGTFLCNCAEGYLGVTCSDDDPCFPEPCFNNGTCTVSGSSYSCACVTGYSGVNCTVMDTDNSNNNNNNNNSNNSNSSPDDDTIIIIIPIVCSVIAICVAGVILYSFKTKRLCFKVHPHTKAEIENTPFRRDSIPRSKNSVSPEDTTSLTAITMSNGALDAKT